MIYSPFQKINFRSCRNFYTPGHIFENFESWYLFKNNFSIFLVLFFLIFSKNSQKAKVNILFGNGRNHHILLETCYLRSLDIISYILYCRECLERPPEENPESFRYMHRNWWSFEIWMLFGMEQKRGICETTIAA